MEYNLFSRNTCTNVLFKLLTTLYNNTTITIRNNGRFVHKIILQHCRIPLTESVRKRRRLMIRFKNANCLKCVVFASKFFSGFKHFFFFVKYRSFQSNLGNPSNSKVRFIFILNIRLTFWDFQRVRFFRSISNRIRNRIQYHPVRGRAHGGGSCGRGSTPRTSRPVTLSRLSVQYLVRKV